jgi:CRP/FNR family cyclic AMP-dependent transcriptional regulator
MKDIRKSDETTYSPDEASNQELPEATPALPALGILSGLSDRSLANLTAFGQYHQFSAGTEIIREGEMQDRFYVVVAGKLTIRAGAGNNEVALSVAGPGECIGEVSLLEPGPASASVRALQDSTMWSMDISDLRAYFSAHAGGAGALLMGMAGCLTKRLRQANELIRHHHVLPVETLPEGRERAITASNAPMQVGFFDRLKKSLAGEKKIRISTKIKL